MRRDKIIGQATKRDKNEFVTSLELNSKQLQKSAKGQVHVTILLGTYLKGVVKD